MKIKVAILEKDASYLNRIVSVFSTKYADKFEIYSFTNQEMALAAIDEAHIDILVASTLFDIDVEIIPKRCGFAYFVDSMDVDTYKEQSAICKFQKADLIYKQILSIYSDVVGNVSGLKLGDDSCKVVAFASPCGGVGSSTMAAAYAVHLAKQGKKVLYLNVEKFGSSDSFFEAEGQFDMSDVIFALKSKKTNLSMKMESCVKQDINGVCFYSQSKVALDMLELTAEDVLRMVSEAEITGSYSYVILDMDFGMDKDTMKVLRKTHAIVWTGDGSEISNSKIARAYTALAIKEQNADTPLTNRISLIYNKFSSKSSKTIGMEEIKNIGGAPKYEHATTAQIMGQLSPMSMFDKIV